jgi:hypothetical protein
MKKLSAKLMVAMMFLVITVLPVNAQEQSWQIDAIPYFWLMGIDADITVGNRTANVDQGFDDLKDYVEFGGGLLVNAVKDNRWVIWFQGDYIALEEDDPKFNLIDKVEVDLTIIETAVGYRFDNPLSSKGWIDALIGLRYTEFETTLSAITGTTKETRDNDYLDAMLVLRPTFPITENLIFIPTLAVGGGDSELIYELQPLLEYRFTENLAARVGYRRLYYDIDNGGQEFDGALHGLILGLKITF